MAPATTARISCAASLKKHALHKALLSQQKVVLCISNVTEKSACSHMSIYILWVYLDSRHQEKHLCGSEKGRLVSLPELSFLLMIDCIHCTASRLGRSSKARKGGAACCQSGAYCTACLYSRTAWLMSLGMPLAVACIQAMLYSPSLSPASADMLYNFTASPAEVKVFQMCQH